MPKVIRISSLLTYRPYPRVNPERESQDSKQIDSRSTHLENTIFRMIRPDPQHGGEVTPK